MYCNAISHVNGRLDRITMDFKDSWNEENAMKILQHPTVDSKLWAEAVEWLLMYGSEEVKEMLLTASGNATDNCFPDLKTGNYTRDGLPCYDIAALADSLGISEEEVKRIITEKEKAHGVRQSVEEDEVYKIQ